MARSGGPQDMMRLWKFWVAAAETGYFSAVTIGARSQMMAMQMLTKGTLPQAESWRMVSEKPQAAMDSLFAIWRANTRLAANPMLLLPAAEAGLRPYRRKTRANARRLSR